MKLDATSAPHVHSPRDTRALMRDVLLALAPCAVAAVCRFGLGALGLMLAATASAVVSEALWQRLTGRRATVSDGSAAVTGLLLALCLPPAAPRWLAAVGSAFAVIVVKGLFGGLGGNVFNPALAARAMLLASWPRLMTAYADAVTAATPLANPAGYSLGRLFLGNIPGCVGEVCKPAILLGLAWLMIQGAVSWHIPASMLAAAALSSLALGLDPLASALSGGLLFGAAFMATDCVTSPMRPAGQWLYGAGAGVVTVLIRRFGGYPEGVTTAILLMNLAVPLLDRRFPRRVYGHGREAAGRA